MTISRAIARALIRRRRGGPVAASGDPPRRPAALAALLVVATLVVVSSFDRAGAPEGVAAAGGNVTFTAFGDAGTGSAGQLALRDRMVQRASEYQLSLLLGDGAYPVGAVADYDAKFFPVYAGLFQGKAATPPPPTTSTPKPLYATPGNHEYDTTGAQGFHDVFVMPTNGPAGVPAEKFYSFDVGGVHFVSFDSHYLVGWNMSTPTAQKDAVRSWLLADLDANSNDVTVVFSHHPAFTAGSHRGELEESRMRTDWFPLFAAHGVDLLLSAHDHSYQRNHPQSGLTSFVSGGGGGTLTAVSPQSYTASSLSDYHFLKVAVAGCTISTVAVRSNGTEFDPWSFSAPTCSSSGPSPSPSAPTGQLFADGFESGDFGAWTSVQTANGGSATVQSTTVASGSRAARLSETGTSGSIAYARRHLGTARSELRVRGAFRIETEGASGANVPLIRLFNASGSRILSLYRQNAAGNRVYVQHSGAYNGTSGLLPLGAWASAELRVVVNGASSTVQVWLEGALIHSTSTASLGSSGVLQVQIGNDTGGQAFALFADDVLVTDGAPAASPSPSTPPASASLQPSSSPSASPSASPSTSPTSSASTAPSISPSAPPTASWFSDGFESGTFAAWTVRTGTTGQASITTASPFAGTYAALLSATNAGGSIAYARADLGEARTSLTATLSVRINGEGSANANVPLVRLFDGTGKRVVAVFRQNQASNRVYVAYGGVNHLSTGSLGLGTWVTLEVRLTVVPSGSTIVVKLGGTTIHTSTAANLGDDGIRYLQVGNDTNKQAFTLVADEVRVTP